MLVMKHTFVRPFIFFLQKIRTQDLSKVLLKTLIFVLLLIFSVITPMTKLWGLNFWINLSQNNSLNRRVIQRRECAFENRYLSCIHVNHNIIWN